MGFDNRASMCALAQEVLKLGHRNIGVISGITKGNDRARQRLEGTKMHCAPPVLIRTA